MSAEEDYLQRQTDRLGTKREFHWKCTTCIMSWFSSVYTRLHSLVSLVKNDTTYSDCRELKENSGRDWECGEDCTSLSQATADKHLTCCLHTSGATWTAGVPAHNNAKFRNNKLRERTVVGKGSQPVDWPSLYLDNCYVAANTTRRQLTTNPVGGLAHWEEGKLNDLSQDEWKMPF